MSNPVKSDFLIWRFALAGWAVLAVLVCGLGFWSATTMISGAVIASGQIEVDQNRQVVQHPDGGVVTKILVEEGDLVKEGDALIRLDPTALLSELKIVESQYFELAARRARLQAERDLTDEVVFDQQVLDRAKVDPEVAELVEGQRNLFLARNESGNRETEQLLKRAEQIGDQIKGVQAQQDAILFQLEVFEKELQDQQSLLERGLAQASRVNSLQREQSRLLGMSGELLSQKAQAEGRITEIDIEILKLENTRREQAISTLRDLQTNERELAEQRSALIERLSRMVVKAPVSGVVYGMQVFAERSVVRPADPVMYLIPQDRPLVIAARVEVIHIDKIFVDQPVSLRFSALDQRQTPELFGHVTKVSADAFTDDATRTSFYRAEVQLSEGEMERLPPNTTLVPGMPVETFMKTDDRTPLAYLIKPFMDYFSKAFRES